MQLIPRGPDVPDRLLAAHEEGQVVFFCGAGISCGAGLPLFSELTKHVVVETGNDWKDFEKRPYDETLEILQRRVAGGRSYILRIIQNKLQPEYDLNHSKDIHEALIELSKTNSSPLQTKIVTTNFDRIFEVCLEENSDDRPPSLIAPRLPIPKDHYWNGIVYLHGLLPEAPYDDQAIDNLIFTSGDFGRAYLSERWAARFAAEMFRNYVVCFIGYSLSDPVMRYLIDAMAADQRDGYPTPDHYIFTTDSSEWNKQADHLNPLLKPIEYKKTRNHHLLRETLVRWAKNYSSGIDAKKEIISHIANTAPPPKGKSRYRDGENTGRLMWALCNPKASRDFANMEPRPSWEWMKVLTAREFDFDDLESFGHKVMPMFKPDSLSPFSLLEPIARFGQSSNLSLTTISNHYDDSSQHFYRWISRHLDNPDVAIFLQKYAPLNSSLKREIRKRLDEQFQHPQESKSDRSFPNDPDIKPVMRHVWELVLAGYIRGQQSQFDRDFDFWNEKFEIYGLTSLIKQELKELLKPQLKMSMRSSIFSSSSTPPTIEKSKYISDFFSLDIDLKIHRGAGDLKKYALAQGTSTEDKIYFLHIFIETLSNLFEFGDSCYPANLYSSSYSMIGTDDIFEQPKNFFFRQWIHLGDATIKLLIQLIENDPETVKLTVEKFLDSSFSFLECIGLKVLKDTSLFDIDEVFEFLVRNEGKLLTECYHRYSQLAKLLQMKAREFSVEQIQRIEHILLSYDSDGDHSDRNYKSDTVICLLQSLGQGGTKLSEKTSERFEVYNEVDRLKIYFEKGKPLPEPELIPNDNSSDSEWMEFIKEHPDELVSRPLQESRRVQKVDYSVDPWDGYCRRKSEKAFGILKNLYSEGILPKGRWEFALSSWESEFKNRAKNPDASAQDSDAFAQDKFINLISVFSFLKTISNDDYYSILRNALQLLNSCLSIFAHAGDEKKNLLDHLLARACKLIEENYVEGEAARFIGDVSSKEFDFMMAAINSPIGILAEIILRYQFIQTPEHKKGLEKITKEYLEKLLVPQKPSFSLSHCPIAEYATDLYLYDKDWTKKNLLPLFSWECNQNANIIWEGYLWRANWTPDFLSEIHDDFLETSGHLKAGSHPSENYVRLITYLALNKEPMFKPEEYRKCIASFDKEHLFHSLSAVQDFLASAEDAEKVWQKSIQPFFQYTWPQDRSSLSDRMFDVFADIIVMTGKAFPDAVNFLSLWLERLTPAPHYYANLILETLLGIMPKSIPENEDNPISDGENLVVIFPKESLKFLSALPLQDPYVGDRELIRKCLDHLKEAGLERNPQYKALKDLLD